MKNTIIVIALLLCALTVRADYYRWGTVSRNNYVYTYNDKWEVVSNYNAHAYLYLGTAQITEEGGKKVVRLDNLTYITDGGISNCRFGNYSAVKAADFNSDDKVFSAGGQAYTIILVGKSKLDESLSGAIQDNYEARSVTLFTSTSIGATSTDTPPVQYADCATGHAFNDKTKCIENVKFVRTVEPVGKGGYVTGYASGAGGKVPSPSSAGVAAGPETARMYIYKGSAAIRNDGVIDFSRLTYITNFIPVLHGFFGNYKSDGVAKANLYESDLISPEGGENFAIFVVSTDGKPAAMPARFYDSQNNNYVAIYNVTSVKKLTDDNWQYAQLVISKRIEVSDYNKGLSATLYPMWFYDHMEFINPFQVSLKIPKSYVVGFVGADATDDELMYATTNKWPTTTSPYSLMESYVLCKDPNTKTDIPTLLLVQGSSTTSVQLNVSNVTVNEKANAKVKYGLISSASPDFADPTVEVRPQASPELEATLPTNGVKYYRATLTIQGR